MRLWHCVFFAFKLIQQLQRQWIFGPAQHLFIKIECIFARQRQHRGLFYLFIYLLDILLPLFGCLLLVITMFQCANAKYTAAECSLCAFCSLSAQIDSSPILLQYFSFVGWHFRIRNHFSQFIYLGILDYYGFCLYHHSSTALSFIAGFVIFSCFYYNIFPFFFLQFAVASFSNILPHALHNKLHI